MRHRPNPGYCWSVGVLMTSLVTIDGMQPPPRFTEVSRSAGIHFSHVSGSPETKKYIFEVKGGGVGFFDFDNDGWQDILLVQGSTLEKLRGGDSPHSALFRNQGDGTFRDVTRTARLTHRGWGMGVTFGDYNSDGFADIYLTYLGPNVLYRNNGDGTFTDVTEAAGVGDPRWSTSAAFGDYDQDGDLDLYSANYLDIDLNKLPEPGSDRFCFYVGRPTICGPKGIPAVADVLYRNNGDGTFTDVSEEAGVAGRDRRAYYGLGVVWADLDNDRDLDIYVANDTMPNLLFVNQGDGTFREGALDAGLAVSGDGREQASMGVDVADYNNDGLLDVFVTHFANDYSTLYRNLGGLVFEDSTLESRIQGSEWPFVSWGTFFVDFNHDGWKDIYHSNGHVYPWLRDVNPQETYYQPGSVYLNGRDGTFRDVSKAVGPDIQARALGRGAAFGDYDNDGDLDFIVSNLDGTPQLFRNDRLDGNHWITFKTVGRRSNRDGIGTRISVRTGAGPQVWEVKRTVGIYSGSDHRAHFGLGEAATVEHVRVRWPSGKTQEFRNVQADFHYVVDEDDGLRREDFARKGSRRDRCGSGAAESGGMPGSRYRGAPWCGTPPGDVPDPLALRAFRDGRRENPRARPELHHALLWTVL